MERKKRKNTFSKQKPSMIVCKIILIVSVMIYPVFMVMMTGAGIISNRSSYGAEFSRNGALLIISGFLVSAGAFLCLFRKSLPNLISFILNALGAALCMTELYRITSHARSHGWNGVGRYENLPVADMYTERILPVLIPVLLTAFISAVQFFSYDACEERRERKRKKQELENAPAPQIIDDSQ